MKRVTILCLLGFALACEPNTAPPTSLAGAWPLRTVNNSYIPTPWERIAAETFRRVRMDSLILTDGGAVRRWTFIEDSMKTSGSGFVVRDSGTYTRDGESVSFQLSREAAPVTGFVDGTGLSVAFDGLMYRYARP